MRISELSAASGIPTATIKYYLRERLIPAGHATAQTRAEYDERHLGALGLVRALLATGLGINEVRSIVEAIDQPVTGPQDLFAKLRELEIVLSKRHGNQQPLRPDTEATISKHGWDPHINPAAARELQSALDDARSAGFNVTDSMQQLYAQTMTSIAAAELQQIPGRDGGQAMRHALLGELLMERVLLAMRRLAQGTIAHNLLRNGPPPQASETSSE